MLKFDDFKKSNFMKKPMYKMLVSVGILFGLIFGYQAIKGYIGKKYMMMGQPPVTVTAMKVENQPWQPKIKASGSLRAVHGVEVTAEIAGLVRTVYFKPGSETK